MDAARGVVAASAVAAAQHPWIPLKEYGKSSRLGCGSVAQLIAAVVLRGGSANM